MEMGLSLTKHKQSWCSVFEELRKIVKDLKGQFRKNVVLVIIYSGMKLSFMDYFFALP